MAPKSENKMGKWGATSYIIGNIIGSGIFITPNTILTNINSIGGSLVIWLVSAIIATIGALCYVELGTMIQRSGADFAYLSYVKWRGLAFAFMMCGCVLTYPAILAIQSETFGEYVLQGLQIKFCDEKINFLARKMIGFSTVWLLLYLNFFSVRKFVAKFQIFASFAKLFSSAIIILTGLYVLCFTPDGTKNLRENIFANTSLNAGQLTSAFFAGLYSYDGWDVLNFGIEDLSNPKVSLVFAIIFGMSLVTVIFLAMNISFFIVLSVSQIQNSNAVATTFAQASLGRLQHLIPLLVCIVLIGSLNSTLFSASRYLYAAARSRQFPAFISCINVKHDSPRAALFLHVVLALGVSLVGDLDRLLDCSGFAQWIQRSLTMLALLYIRYHISHGGERSRIRAEMSPKEASNGSGGVFRMPIVIPIVFLVLCMMLVVVTMVKRFADSAVFSVAIILFGLLAYVVFIRRPVDDIAKTMAENGDLRVTSRKSSMIYETCDRLSQWMNDRLCVFMQIVFNLVVDIEDPPEMEDSLDVDQSSEFKQLCNEKSTLKLNGSQVHPTDSNAF